MRRNLALAALTGVLASTAVGLSHADAAPAPTVALVQKDQAGLNVHQGVCTAPARALKVDCAVVRTNLVGATLWQESTITRPGPMPTQLEAVTTPKPVDAVGGYYRAVVRAYMPDGRVVVVKSGVQASIGQPGDVDTDGVIWNVAPAGNSWTRTGAVGTNHTNWL